MKITYKQILLSSLVLLPIITGIFKQCNLEIIAVGVSGSFVVTVCISLVYYLKGGFSK